MTAHDQHPDPAFRALLEGHFAEEIPPADADRLDQAVAALMARVQSTDRRKAKSAVRTLPWSAARVATGFIACTALVASMWVVLSHPNRTLPLAKQAEVTTYATQPGQTRVVRLPDGSQVTLAPQSRVKVADDFGGDMRIVTLTGEALFTVNDASRRPFVVWTGSVRTQVLGTIFDVRQYPHDTGVRVVVLTGKIMTGTPRRRVTLVAGTMAEVTDSTVVASEIRDASALTQWTAGQLVFKNTPVPVMLAAVGHWYGYDFRLTDSALAHRHVTTVLMTDDREQLFAALRDLLNVTMTFEHAPDGGTRIPVVILRAQLRGNMPPHVPSVFSHLSEVGK